MGHAIYTVFLLFLVTSLIRSQTLEDFCARAVAPPADLLQCGTCTNRCGAKAVLTSLWRPKHPRSCSCDRLCLTNNDCCADFQTACSSEFTKAVHQLSTQSPIPSHANSFSCLAFKPALAKAFNTSVRTSCSDSSPCRYSNSIVDDVNLFVPMYDTQLGVHYASAYCALCNNAARVVPWSASLRCNESPVISPARRPSQREAQASYKQSGYVNSTDEYASVRAKETCSLVLKAPPNSLRPCLREERFTCRPNCANQQLVNNCTSGPKAPTIVRGVIYRNAYCALCATNRPRSVKDMSCSIDVPPIGLPGIPGCIGPTCIRPSISGKPGGAIVKTFSLTLVFDFNPARGLAVGRHPIPDCPTGEVYVQSEGNCRARVCPEGFVLKGDDCKPKPYQKMFKSLLQLTESPDRNNLEIYEQNKTAMDAAIEHLFRKLINDFDVLAESFSVDTNTNFNNQSISISTSVECQCNFSAINQPFSLFENRFGSSLRSVYLLFVDSAGMTQISISNTGFGGTPYASPPVWRRPTRKCEWLKYQMKEVNIINGTLTILASGKQYKPTSYVQLNDTVTICVRDAGVVDIEEETSKEDFVLGLVTLILVSLSILCLIIRILLHPFILHFHRKPGRLQLQLTLALLIAFVFLLAGVLVSNYEDVCVAMAILLAYGFLATFTWMNVIAFDTWRAFHPSAAFSSTADNSSSLWKHALAGWGVPALVTIITIITHFVDMPNEHFSSSLGGARCWYSQRYAMLTYFGIPVGISILVNIILFISTSLNLRNAFKNTSAIRKKDQKHFGIYVKLFFMMGISWVFGFIAAFTDIIAIDIIFIVLNALQGVYLFVGLVCTKQVHAELKTLVRKRSAVYKSSSSGTGTRDTPLNTSSASTENIIKTDRKESTA